MKKVRSLSYYIYVLIVILLYTYCRIHTETDWAHDSFLRIVRIVLDEIFHLFDHQRSVVGIAGRANQWYNVSLGLRGWHFVRG